MAEPNIPPGFDFTDPDLCWRRMPAEELAELRRTTPVWWNAQLAQKNNTMIVPSSLSEVAGLIASAMALSRSSAVRPG